MRQAPGTCSQSDDPRGVAPVPGLGAERRAHDAGVQHVGRDTRAEQAARQIVSEHHLGQPGGVVRVLP